MAGTSFAYFASINTKESRLFQLVTSAHGLLAAVLFVSAVLLQSVIPSSSHLLVIAFTSLYLVPAGLVVISLAMYPGPKVLHFLQLLNIPAMLWAFLASVILLTRWAI